MNTHHASNISLALGLLTLAALAALACSTLAGAEPAPTQEPLVASTTDEPTEAIIIGDTAEPEATAPGEGGEPPAGDCTTDINPGSDILLQVTEGIEEIRFDQFISVAAEVTNPTDQWVWYVLVWVRMCDDNGKLLHIESNHTYPTQIPPGGTVPFHVLRDVANTDSKVIPTQFRVEALGLPGDDSKRAELVNFKSDLDNDKLTLTATFQNTGSAPCLSPTVIAAFYKDGKAYETKFLYAEEISEIAPGESSEVNEYTFVPEGTTDTKFFASCD